MGKLKTHKGVARRINVTGTGKLAHARAGRRHLLAGKASKRMRRLRKAAQISARSETKLRRLLPYTA